MQVDLVIIIVDSGGVFCIDVSANKILYISLILAANGKHTLSSWWAKQEPSRMLRKFLKNTKNVDKIHFSIPLEKQFT